MHYSDPKHTSNETRTMITNRSESNTELQQPELQQSFEPLRIGFALLALLLGAMAALHF